MRSVNLCVRNDFTAVQTVTALDLTVPNCPLRRTGRSLSAPTGNGKRFCPGLMPPSNAKLTKTENQNAE